MEAMASRQTLPTILAALLPQNLVRCVWRQSGRPGSTQTTGVVLGTTDELLQMMPLQGHGRRPVAIHVDRIHSVVVLREGDAAQRARQVSASHLREAAHWLASGDTDKARAHIATAGVKIPGLLPRPSRHPE